VKTLVEMEKREGFLEEMEITWGNGSLSNIYPI
jgi:hypothetical protein